MRLMLVLKKLDRPLFGDFGMLYKMSQETLKILPSHPNLFVDSSLPCYAFERLVNSVDILTLEFESIVDTGKIGEEGYNIVPIKVRDHTLSSHLRSAERKRLLTL
ncbi:hypothetical protein AVEN_71381-1 [Araneus ventricosus]|uniref:Uncharacterized protein n=1 Tax=Araneus ventricosus TaxID=182803 RepID=A0A4Y2BHK7_ARAVE|nr:hypothetical protein AVEN_71381-1 [Araneus ventricosus]